MFSTPLLLKKKYVENVYLVVSDPIHSNSCTTFYCNCSLYFCFYFWRDCLFFQPASASGFQLENKNLTLILFSLLFPFLPYHTVCFVFVLLVCFCNIAGKMCCFNSCWFIVLAGWMWCECFWVLFRLLMFVCGYFCCCCEKLKIQAFKSWFLPFFRYNFVQRLSS